MKRSFLTRKEKIILTTIDLIHELGIANVSIKEIAKREEVTEAALYKHFKSKEEILAGVIEYYVRYDNYIYATIEKSDSAAKDKIFTYFKLYAQYYENYHAITAMIGVRENLLSDENFSDRIKQMIREEKQFLMKLLTIGIEEGTFQELPAPEDMAYVLMGTFEKLISVWRLKEYSFCLQQRATLVINQLLKLYEKKET